MWAQAASSVLGAAANGTAQTALSYYNEVSTRCFSITGRVTDLFVGDFRQLLVGQRLMFTVQTLTGGYAELGQIGIVAHWRGDVQLARPRAFAADRYLQGAV